MSLPPITDAQIADLQREYPTLDFSDAERVAVLKQLGPVDVQAAPGSGKTTLLAAKLSLLARHWPHARRGLCVLSHTNVARDEIALRLRESHAGSVLFSHPHFVGTIQTFLHTFLALPLLRSIGINARVIDDKEFAEFSASRVRQNPALRVLAERNPNSYGKALLTLRYIGANCTLSPGDGSLPGETAPSYEKIRALKRSLTADGIFRYDDMFAFAQRALKLHPALRESLSHRFPMVFVDEMQDTSDAQFTLLELALGEGSTFQRFGDINQRILRPNDNAAAAFPSLKTLPVSNSKRFGTNIAEVANKLRVFENQITGDAPAPHPPIAMLTFTNASVKKVISAFRDLAVDCVSEEELLRHGVKAVCARREESSTEGCGRFIGDYLAGSAPSTPTHMQTLTLVSALQSAAEVREASGNMAHVIQNVRRCFHTMLKDLGVAAAAGTKTWRELLAALNSEHATLCHHLVESMVSAPNAHGSKADWHVCLSALTPMLSKVVGRTVLEEEVVEHAIAGYTPHLLTAPASALTASSSIDVHVDTIAAAKGETHAATLVLESIHRSRYDITEALPFLCGEISSLKLKQASGISRLHNLFVGATRPKHLLGFAMHRDRLPASQREALERLSWRLVDVD